MEHYPVMRCASLRTGNPGYLCSCGRTIMNTPKENSMASRNRDAKQNIYSLLAFRICDVAS